MQMDDKSNERSNSKNKQKEGEKTVGFVADLWQADENNEKNQW
jgi:hypothetical protein